MADLSAMGLDPDVEESTGSFQVLPEGTYKVVIVGDRITTTKSGTGKMFEIKLQVIDGQYAGQTVVDRLNIINPNAIAQKIGQGQVRRLCSLTGVPYPCPDSTMMYGKPILATIKVEDFISNKTGNALKSNKVAGYNPVSNVAPKAVQAAVPNTAMASGGTW
mgnify:CR=1 FL=1